MALRRLTAAGLAALIGLLLCSARASALPGPPSLGTGFGADTLAPNLTAAAPYFTRMESLGSSWVRIPVPWIAIAPATRPRHFNAANPADPHYGWYALDALVRDGAATHQHMLLMVSSPPSWACGRGAPPWAYPDTWRPSSSQLGAFARALAKRYSGRFPDPFHPKRALPHVAYFQAWNEPNLPATIAPQWKRTRSGYVPASPAIYRGLLNAFYAGIKSVQPRASVLTAGLAPYGDTPGAARMHPVTFLQGLLARRANFDALDIHPYGVTPTHHAFNADDISTPDLGRLRSVLRAHGAGSKPIWVTEIDWDSKPDPAGLSLPQQARYLAQAFYELWRQGVSHVLWYQPHDLGGTPRGGIPDGGLFTIDGQAKPASSAFRFPFVALRGTDGSTTLWGRAPVSGRVTIEVARGTRWRRLLQLPATSGGVFYAQRRVGSRVTLRAVAGSAASYPWAVG